jgi:hypothetical protein
MSLIREKYKKSIFFLIFIITCIPSLVQGQKFVLDQEIGYQVKQYLFKHYNIDLGIYYIEKLSRKNLLSINDWRELKILGFGYIPRFPEIEFHLTNLQYEHDTTLKVYLTTFPRYNEINLQLNNEIQNKANQLLLNTKFGLFCTDDSLKEIRWIVKHGGKERIAHLFDINRKKPESYNSFLRSKYFYIGLNSTFKHLNSTRDTISFEATFIDDNDLRSIYHLYVSVDQPDNIRLEYITNSKGSNYRRDSLEDRIEYRVEPFKSIKEKVKYLKWALMSNVYLHLVSTKIDSINTPNYPNEEKLLPAYNQILSRLGHLEYGCCWLDEQSKKDLFDRLPISVEPIFRYEDGYKLVTAEHRSIRHPQIEFYKLYLDTFLYLQTVPDPQFHNNDDDLNHSQVPPAIKYDLFYQPNIPYQQKGDDKEYLIPTPLNTPLLDIKYLAGCTYGYNFDTIRHHYDLAYRAISKAVNHYLLALNTENRDVYFISGKDIYLSESIPLYKRPKYDVATKEYRITHSEDESYADTFFKSTILYDYLQDRLYRYLVERLDESNVVFRDKEKMVLRCQGKEYKKPLELEVIFYYDNPEELEVKVLDE